MASAFFRNLRLRQFYHAFNFQSRSSKFHSLPYKSLPDSPPTSFLPDSFAANQHSFLPSFSNNYRFFCTPTTNPVNPSSSSNVNSTPSSGLTSGGNSEKASDGGDSGNANGGHNSGGSENTSEKGKPVRGGPVSWMSFFLLLCTGAGLVYYYDREKRQRIERITNASSVVKEGPSVGKAAIGGSFDLIDHNGKSVTDKDFLGKWNIIYFGFTHCPDICPDELQKLASAIDKIKEKSGLEVVPVFISVDPERDTVEQIREYIKEFHPKLIGLTGSPDEVKKAARAYRVYYMKTEEDGSDYLVDHSIAMYLMDPSMEFVKFFGKNLDDISLADGVIQEIKKHKKVKA